MKKTLSLRRLSTAEKLYITDSLLHLTESNAEQKCRSTFKDTDSTTTIEIVLPYALIGSKLEVETFLNKLSNGTELTDELITKFLQALSKQFSNRGARLEVAEQIKIHIPYTCTSIPSNEVILPIINNHSWDLPYTNFKGRFSNEKITLTSKTQDTLHSFFLILPLWDGIISSINSTASGLVETQLYKKVLSDKPRAIVQTPRTLTRPKKITELVTVSKNLKELVALGFKAEQLKKLCLIYDGNKSLFSKGFLIKQDNKETLTCSIDIEKQDDSDGEVLLAQFISAVHVIIKDIDFSPLEKSLSGKEFAAAGVKCFSNDEYAFSISIPLDRFSKEQRSRLKKYYNKKINHDGIALAIGTKTVTVSTFLCSKLDAVFKVESTVYDTLESLTQKLKTLDIRTSDKRKEPSSLPSQLKKLKLEHNTFFKRSINISKTLDATAVKINSCNSTLIVSKLFLPVKIQIYINTNPLTINLEVASKVYSFMVSCSKQGLQFKSSNRLAKKLFETKSLQLENASKLYSALYQRLGNITSGFNPDTIDAFIREKQPVLRLSSSSIIKREEPMVFLSKINSDLSEFYGVVVSAEKALLGTLSYYISPQLIGKDSVTGFSFTPERRNTLVRSPLANNRWIAEKVDSGRIKWTIKNEALVTMVQQFQSLSSSEGDSSALSFLKHILKTMNTEKLNTTMMDVVDVHYQHSFG